MHFMKPACKTLLIGLLCLTHASNTHAGPKKSVHLEKASPLEPAKLSQTQAATLSIAYLAQDKATAPALPFFLAQPADAGLQGALLGIADNNTTGRFTGQSYQLKEIRLPAEADATVTFKQWVANGIRHIIVNLPSATIAALAKLPEASGVLMYDVASSDDRLRADNCSANLLHLLPSRTMRADALMQYLNKKRWQKIFLVTGPEEADQQYAAAVKRAAQRFGIKIVADKPWLHSFEERRTPESDIPVFTQGVDYDVLVVADEAGIFGDLFAFRTWQPRPVAGTQGLAPLAWHFTHEQWGALQLQNRFRELAKRFMTEQDYAAWLAVRAIGESASRVKSTDFDKIKGFMLGSEFALAGFKGVPLSFRPWDGQLRQPVLLSTDRSLVAVAPIEGFLHQRNELDTLGVDQGETQCRMKQ
jgi:ABC transporter substrate binding protein (PQQ-dependent alcohol dehydrogenase system)